jgi:roadblock/LC7 domain-containing protein
VALNILNYYFRIGSQIMPTKAPDNIPEMFAELMKAMGSMSDLNYHPSIELVSYSGNTNTPIATANAGITNSNSFYIGLDLENYVSASKDSIFCGYNSNTDDIFAIMNFGAQGAATNVRFDAFAMFDSVIVFENSTAYRKF